MKVMQLGKFYPIRGGVEKVMWDLTKGLSERFIDCDMVCAMLPTDTVDFKDRQLLDKDEEDVVLKFNPHGRVICLPAIKKVAATMISPALHYWVRKHAKEYDVIHVHHPDPMACLALKHSHYKGKVVLHWHSDILKQKGLLRLYKPFQSWLIKRADVIVGTSPVYLQGSPWLQKVQDKTAVIPIGIEPLQMCKYEYERILEENKGKKIIFSLGRLVGYKGYEYLVRAAQFLPEDYVVVIGGSGPLRTKLDNLCRLLGMPDKVKFLGWVEDDEAQGWFHACDLFVLSSIMKTEAFAIVQAEAMSCGKPVVSTDIPGSGVPWVNADGYSGRVVPICDPRALADAIVSICKDPQFYEEYSKRARKRYEDVFTFDEMIDNAIALYNRL